MRKNRRILLVALVLIFAFSVVGCKSDVHTLDKYDKSKAAVSVSTQTVASNSSYELLWDDEAKCVLLKCLSTGKIWSNIPYEYLLEGGSSANINSTLNISVMNLTNRQINPVRGYIDAVTDGRVFSQKIDDGIKVTYCFDKYEISVPVYYRLRNDSLCVSIDSSEIKEGHEDYSLVSVTPAPFMCSTQNHVQGNYLFVPSGCGALMYADERAEEARKFSGEVYGTDGTRLNSIVLANEEPIRLPVFGAKNGNDAILGILEKGAGAAFIEAEAGNYKTGYSNIYASFYVRGYDVFEEDIEDLTLTSELRSQGEFSVGYYPLSGKDANYNGMAKTYAGYLNENNALDKNTVKQSSYGIEIMGGTNVTVSVLGIPKEKLVAMTTFAQANKIITELGGSISEKPAVLLSGFGKSGINPNGYIAGGYTFPSLFGTDKERKALESVCLEAGVPLYTDFDIIRFDKSGNGFSTISDKAKTAILKASEQYPVNNPLRQFDKTQGYHLLKRSLLNKAYDKLAKFCEKEDVSAISLLTLGSVAYSDYTENKYYVKGNIESDVSKILNAAKDRGFPVASGANAYAAASSETVFDVPLENGHYDALDVQIPFYQIVFRGRVALYSTAINTADNPRKQLMLAATSGTGLGFSLIGSYNNNYMESNTEKLYSMYYSDNKEYMSDVLSDSSQYNRLFSAISNAGIESYEILSSQVSKTIFDNGVIVYGNHSNKSVETEIGELGAYEFTFK